MIKQLLTFNGAIRVPAILLAAFGFTILAPAAHGQRMCAPYANDVDGPNDYPNQSDLTQYCSNFIDIAGTPSLLAGVSFDDILSTGGGANTNDLGIYYDTDGDGNANYAIFVSVQLPATEPFAPPGGTIITQQLYVCNDTSPSECTGATLALTQPITCNLYNPSETDPFPTGDYYPYDATVECSIPLSFFGDVPDIQFLNACTLTSASITSAKKDCGAYEGGGFITIVKNASPIDGTFDFEVKSTLTPQGGTNDYSPPPITTVGGTGTSGQISVPNSNVVGTFSVNEISIPAEWSLADFECDAGTKGDTGYSGITINSGTEVTCTFNDELRYGSIKVTKTVDWNGYTPDTNLFPHNSFEVCIDDAGDLTDTPVCQDVAVTEDQGVWSGTTTFTDVLAGNYNITETDPGTNWAVTLPATAIEVLAGQEAEATVANRLKTGTITLSKALLPTSDTGTFDLLIKDAQDATVASETGVGDGGTLGPVTVLIGSYTISELGAGVTDLADYVSSYACDVDPEAAGTSTSVSIADGDAVSCTFTNTRKTGTVTIVKTVTGCPDAAVCGPDKWTFTIDGYDPLKTDDTIELPTGSYTIAESGPAGYIVSSASGACSLKDGKIDLTVNEGTSTCTINNAPNLKLALTKEVNVTDPDNEAYWFDANNNASAVPVIEYEPVWYRVCLTNTGDWPLSNLSLEDQPYQWAVDEQCKDDLAATTLQPGETACCIYEIAAYPTRDKENCDSANPNTCKNRAQGTGYYGGTKTVSNTENAFYKPLEGSGLPIELSAIEAVLVDKGTVRLTWETATETNNAGFAIEMRKPEHTAFDDEVAFVEGAGMSTTPKTYQYTVSDLEPGPYAFRLRQVDFDGQTTFSPEVEVTVTIPDKYYLSEVYPNPFNPTANIRFGTQESVQTRIELYNVRGQMVKILYEGTPEANAIQTIRITADDLSSGVYIVRIVGPSFAGARKMVLFK